jgi:hypothetical protein
MPSGSITLLAVAARTDVLAVACSRCKRTGRYPLDRLITRHGSAFGLPMLLRLLSQDCPKQQSISMSNLCGIFCPELSALFNVPRG